jgi:hypothetical protein
MLFASTIQHYRRAASLSPGAAKLLNVTNLFCFEHAGGKGLPACIDD